MFKSIQKVVRTYPEKKWAITTEYLEKLLSNGYKVVIANQIEGGIIEYIVEKNEEEIK